jgi:DNA polymerase-3 subunit epsilon/CBS domain-containing protein
LRQQLEDTEVGRPPSNAVELRRLSRRDKDRLRAALRAVRNLDTMARDLLFTT